MHVMQFQNEGLPSSQGVQPVGLWLASLEHHTHDEISAAMREHLANLARSKDLRRKVTIIDLQDHQRSGCHLLSLLPP